MYTHDSHQGRRALLCRNFFVKYEVLYHQVVTLLGVDITPLGKELFRLLLLSYYRLSIAAIFYRYCLSITAIDYRYCLLIVAIINVYCLSMCVPLFVVIVVISLCVPIIGFPHLLTPKTRVLSLFLIRWAFTLATNCHCYYRYSMSFVAK